MKSILAALDGSEGSLVGLEQASGWAARLNAELRAVFVQDERQFVRYPTYSAAEGTIPRPVPLEGAAREQAEAAAATQEAELRAACQRVLAGQSVRAELNVVRGPVEHTLIREARAADLVVLGKRGRGSGARVEAAGPTTETLIHEALRPVLVVPGGAHATGPMLVPYDGSTGVQRVVVPGVRLAAAARIPVTVLTLAEDRAHAEGIQAPLKRYLRAHGIVVDFRIVQARDSERGTARIILELAGELQAGMIAMGAFSVGPIKEFFVGSVTREVLSRSACPVLMMT